METSEEILNLDVVYSTLTQGETWDLCNILNGGKEILSVNIAFLENLTDNESISVCEDAKRRLLITEKNIKTLEEALLCHESKQFVKRTMLGGTVTLCLN